MRVSVILVVQRESKESNFSVANAEIQLYSPLIHRDAVPPGTIKNSAQQLQLRGQIL